MKNHTIKTPTAELLIVEAKDDNIAWAIVFQKYGARAVVDYTLLGKPDEIKDEDAARLFYNPIDSANLTHYANLRNLFSLIESEIYWENPWGVNGAHLDSYKHLWKEAEKKTFDRNRSIILKKNK